MWMRMRACFCSPEDKPSSSGKSQSAPEVVPGLIDFKAAIV